MMRCMLWQDVMCWWPRVVVMLSVAVAAGPSPAVWAESAATQPAGADGAESRRRDPVLAALASENYAARQRATRRLMREGAIDNGRLAELFRQARVPEQRHRLLDVARHRLIARMCRRRFDGDQRGALGVMHRTAEGEALPNLDRAAVEVIQTLAGFPAYAHLEPGDLILGLNGQTLPPTHTAERFEQLIKQQRNGERIELLIQRDGDEKRLAFELGAMQGLQAVYNPGDLSLREPFGRAWQRQRRALLAEGQGQAEAAQPR